MTAKDSLPTLFTAIQFLAFFAKWMASQFMPDQYILCLYDKILHIFEVVLFEIEKKNMNQKQEVKTIPHNI